MLPYRMTFPIVAITLVTSVALTGCGADNSSDTSITDDSNCTTCESALTSTRIYQGFDTTFPQSSNDNGNVGAQLTIDRSLGTVSLTSDGGTLSSSITPGYDSYGYQPLTTAGWYLFEAPGALAVLVKHPTSGLQQAQIDRIYVGILKSDLACPSDGKTYGLSYGLRLANGTPFGGNNSGAQFTYNVATSSLFSTFTLAGTFPSYTGKQSVTSEFEMITTDQCSGSGVYSGSNAAIVNALLGSSYMIGAYNNNSSGFRTSVFIGNSSSLTAVSGYAGTYDGVLINDPNGSTWSTGVTISESGLISGAALVSGTSPTLRTLGSSSNQLVLTAGTGGSAEEWLVTPVQYGTYAALWGTRSVSDITTGNDQFFFLVRRP